MKRTDNVILEKIVGYCDDIDSLLERYDRDFDIVWNTLTKEIPDLRAKVMDILKEISTDKKELR